MRAVLSTHSPDGSHLPPLLLTLTPNCNDTDFEEPHRCLLLGSQAEKSVLRAPTTLQDVPCPPTRPQRQVSGPDHLYITLALQPSA